MLIKIGAKIVSHGRHLACQMAEVAIRRATLPPVPGGHVQRQESNQTPGAGNDNGILWQTEGRLPGYCGANGLPGW
jgi:hypothetical protein